jgi:uncharacterized protein YodC (DUF2158 family)
MSLLFRIVMLNSGGPPMFVINQRSDGICECIWEGFHEFSFGDFHYLCLTRIDDDN